MKKVFLFLMLLMVFTFIGNHANALPVLSTGGGELHLPQWMTDLGHWLFD